MGNSKQIMQDLSTGFKHSSDQSHSMGSNGYSKDVLLGDGYSKDPFLRRVIYQLVALLNMIKGLSLLGGRFSFEVLFFEHLMKRCLP